MTFCIFGIVDVYISMEYVHLITHHYGICTFDYTLLWNMYIFMEYIVVFSLSYVISSLLCFLLIHKLRDIYLVFLFAKM